MNYNPAMGILYMGSILELNGYEPDMSLTYNTLSPRTW